MESGQVKHTQGLLAAASDHDTSIDVDTLAKEYQVMLNELENVFRTRKTVPIEWRLEQLANLRQAVVDLGPEIEDCLKADLGRCKTESFLAECFTVISEIDHVVENLEDWMKDQQRGHPAVLQPGSSKLSAQPLGVILILSPWNYPIQLALGAIIAAVSAGNCCVVKPSEVAPNCGALVEKICVKYLDNECIRVVQGAVPETSALLKLRWDKIHYTGNGAVGRIVSAAAAKHLTPCILELGGKSPVYVDKSCNIPVSAKRLLLGKFNNCSQTCIAPDAVFLHRDIEREFLDELTKQLKNFYGENPQSSPDLGRIINERHWDRITKMLDPADHQGVVLTGGMEYCDRSSKYIAPTLILNPNVESRVMTEEIFGPVLPIMVVDDIEDAADFVNKREHPLASYVFAEDQSVIDHVIENTIAGGMTINDCLMHFANPDLPFGGVGESGTGNYHGKFGFDAMTHWKPIMSRSTWLDPSPRYPPYVEERLPTMKALLTTKPIGKTTRKVLTAAAAGAFGFALLSKM